MTLLYKELSGQVDGVPPGYSFVAALAWVEVNGPLRTEIRWYKTLEEAKADLKIICANGIAQGASATIHEKLPS